MVASTWSRVRGRGRVRVGVRVLALVASTWYRVRGRVRGWGEGQGASLGREHLVQGEG